MASHLPCSKTGAWSNSEMKRISLHTGEIAIQHEEIMTEIYLVSENRHNDFT